MNETNNKQQIILGKIVGVHGVGGALLFKAYGDIDNLTSYEKIYDNEGRFYEISSVRIAKKGAILIVKGLTDRTEAESLKGRELFTDRVHLPDLEEDEFYYTDLIGLDVYEQEGTLIGGVLSLDNHGAGDIIEIKLKESKKTILLPFHKDFVLEVNQIEKFISVYLPDNIDD